MKRPPTLDLTTFATAPDEARVRIGTVSALFGVSGNTVWRRVKAGLIPKPHKDVGATYWKAGDLRRALAGTAQCSPQK
jgi:predicted DNA-binding transcriptional regulator AlpA